MSFTRLISELIRAQIETAEAEQASHDRRIVLYDRFFEVDRIITRDGRVYFTDGHGNDAVLLPGQAVISFDVYLRYVRDRAPLIILFDRVLLPSRHERRAA